MATVYVIVASPDEATLRARVLRTLPSEGYDSWVGRGHLVDVPEHVLVQAMGRSRAILVVLSPALLASADSMREIALAPIDQVATVVVRLAPVDEAAEIGALGRLRALPHVDGGSDDAGQQLGALLPPFDDGPSAAPADWPVERIDWNEEVFSGSLAAAMTRHDHARGRALLGAFEQHLEHRPYSYADTHAYADLQRLRQARAFELMRRLGSLLLASGTRSDRVRRLQAQALIETGDFDGAINLLESIIGDRDASPREVDEAHGLLGRVFKQRYVNAPAAPGASEWMRRAIDAYEGVYQRDAGQLWHGVNAASCLLRAARDGGGETLAERAREIAAGVLNVVTEREREAALEVWDCASRVEALVALQRYEDAAVALGVYLRHPDMQAFEVSSTKRQFDELLELGRRQPGASLLEQLQDAVERYRAGGIAMRPTRGAGSDVAESGPLVIRLRDPDWAPEAVPGLVVQQRLGTVATARGTRASVQALLVDPAVMSVEVSRPAGRMDCDRSVPFIGVAAQYAGSAGPYAETGDSALVAVIDDGIDIFHHAFRDAAGRSRIIGIWDQTASGGTPPAGFGYGRYYDESEIAAAVKDAQWPADLPDNVDGHGTHVASIAVGRATNEFAGGVAPDAKILVVISGAGGPIGYSQCHIEALAFIDAVAKARNMPVVVNLSQGMNAGAHDGKSALEVAFDAFTESGRRPGRVVVKSAGNERGNAGHARITLARDGIEVLRWQRSAGADTTERLELWWSSADEVAFRLLGPDGQQKTEECSAARPEVEGDLPGSGPYRLVFTRRHIDNGDSLLVVELGGAVAPAALGDWALELRADGVPDGGTVHAWIERTAGTPSRFLDHVDEEMTLSIPATAASVISVGAIEAARPIRVGDFSSYGPTRDGQRKPLVAAPGVDVRAARGGTDEDALKLNGTSMAAPHVAGAIALLLSRSSKAGRVPNANQIAGALRQKTQNFSGHWDRGQGWGVIDVAALLAAF